MSEPLMSPGLDFTEAEIQLNNFDNKVENRVYGSKEILKTVDEESKRSYNNVLNIARGSMMMVSGIASMIGGTVGQVFSAAYTTGISIFTLYKTIAATTTTFNPIQGAIQFAAVMLAMMNLTAIATKQRETSRAFHGITQSLHGVSQMISNYSI